MIVLVGLDLSEAEFVLREGELVQVRLDAVEVHCIVFHGGPEGRSLD